jgi:hypothetical protein
MPPYERTGRIWRVATDTISTFGGGLFDFRFGYRWASLGPDGVCGCVRADSCGCALPLQALLSLHFANGKIAEAIGRD